MIITQAFKDFIQAEKVMCNTLVEFWKGEWSSQNEGVKSAFLCLGGTAIMAAAVPCALLNLRNVTLKPRETLLKLTINISFFVWGLDLFKVSQFKGSLLPKALSEKTGSWFMTLSEDLENLTNKEQGESARTRLACSCITLLFLGLTAHQLSLYFDQSKKFAVINLIKPLIGTIFFSDIHQSMTHMIPLDVAKRVREKEHKRTLETWRKKNNESAFNAEIERFTKAEEEFHSAYLSASLEGTVIIKPLFYLVSNSIN